jgi:hypothetical protein
MLSLAHSSRSCDTLTHLNLLVPEGEEEALAVLCAEPVDAPGVNGPGQVVVHILLGVPLVLVPPRPDTQPKRTMSQGKLKGTVSQDFLLQGFFHESSSPKPLKLTLGSVRVFSTI